MVFGRILCLCSVFCVLFITSCDGKQSQSGNGFALVELYTSEGCSSCPSADAVLAKIHNEYKERVYVMEFHVDYWNYIGWKDPFSNAEYTKRQQRYVALFHLNSAYTPQAVVNGVGQMVGSDDAKLHSVVNEELQKMAPDAIQVAAKGSAGNIIVQYKTTANRGQLLNIAIVQKQAQTNVKRGENNGRKLQHINIVRSLKTINDTGTDGTAIIPLPEGLYAKDCIVIAYTQQADTWKITGAAECAVN